MFYMFWIFFDDCTAVHTQRLEVHLPEGMMDAIADVLNDRSFQSLGRRANIYMTPPEVRSRSRTPAVDFTCS